MAFDVGAGELRLARAVSEWIELAAITFIAITVVLATIAGVRSRITHSSDDPYRVFKQRFAKGLLLGLDLLIAADVIRTVTLESSFENVSVLGMLVLIRIVLAWSLVVDVEGRWPWQPQRDDRPPQL